MGYYLLTIDDYPDRTQDLARQFLSASNPGEKYSVSGCHPTFPTHGTDYQQLFLKGTLLTQLKEEYDVIDENCNKITTVLRKKQGSISQLETRYRDAESRYQKAQNLADAEMAIDKLKREMAWAHVAEKEQELSDIISKSTRERERLAKVQEKLEEARQHLDETSNKLNDAETRIRQEDSPDELRQQRDLLNGELSTGKTDLRKAKV